MSRTFIIPVDEGTAFSAAKEAQDRAVPVRARRTRRSHEIMTPRSADEGQEVNSCKADEVFADHAWSPDLSANQLSQHLAIAFVDRPRDLLPHTTAGKGHITAGL